MSHELVLVQAYLSKFLHTLTQWQEVHVLARENPKKESLLQRTAETFDLPGEVLLGLPRLTITGGQRVVVENHHGLMDYSSQQIVVAGGKMALKLIGTDLKLRAMTADSLLITGQILHVEFIY